MLFLQHYVLLRANLLNCISAVSQKPLLKCFQEPSIEFLPATPYGHCNMPHLQLLTIEKCHLYNEIWCFHNCSLRQPTREMFGSFCQTVRSLFFKKLLFLAGKERSIKFLPTGEKLWNLVPAGSSHIAQWTESLISYSFNYTAFQYLQCILPPEFRLFLVLFLFCLFGWFGFVLVGWLICLGWGVANRDLCSPVEIRGVCSPPVGANTSIPWS